MDESDPRRHRHAGGEQLRRRPITTFGGTVNPGAHSGGTEALLCELDACQEVLPCWECLVVVLGWGDEPDLQHGPVDR